jgi:hypothetical protein
LERYVAKGKGPYEQGYENVYCVIDYLNQVASEELGAANNKLAQDAHVAGVRMFWKLRTAHLRDPASNPDPGRQPPAPTTATLNPTERVIITLSSSDEEVVVAVATKSPVRVVDTPKPKGLAAGGQPKNPQALRKEDSDPDQPKLKSGKGPSKGKVQKPVLGKIKNRSTTTTTWVPSKTGGI